MKKQIKRFTIYSKTHLREKALSIAKKLLVEGMTVQKISELTGLDIDEFQTE